MAERKKAKDVMTRDLEVAHPEMTIQEAAQKMKAKDIGSLPVVEGNRLVGVITDRDITIRATAEAKSPTETKVSEVMTRDNLVAVREDADLVEAETIMHDRQIRRLPIVNSQNELLGYVTLAQVARTEDECQAGRVLKGVSQPGKPPSMESYGKKRSKKTG
jgi:CBS domain-containing protein